MKFLTQYNPIWQQISVGSREKVETFFKCWVQTVAMATYMSQIIHKQAWQRKGRTGKQHSPVVGDKYLSCLGKQSTYTLLLIDAVQDSIKLFHAIGVDPEEPAWMTEKSSFIMDWLPDNATLSTVELITAIWALYLGYIYNILDSHKKGMIKRIFVP